MMINSLPRFFRGLQVWKIEIRHSLIIILKSKKKNWLLIAETSMIIIYTQEYD